MTLLPVRTAAEIAAALPTVLQHVRADGIVAYPTETVYGFGGRVTARAVERLRELKSRDQLKPFLLLVSGPDQAPGVQWTGTERILAERFWPGPLTIALRTVTDRFPRGIMSEQGTVALRASPHPFVLALTDALGEPVTSTSANAPGALPLHSAAAVAALLAESNVQDVLVLDGGELPPSLPSTVVATDEEWVSVLREGAIPVDELRKQLAGTGIHVR